MAHSDELYALVWAKKSEYNDGNVEPSHLADDLASIRIPIGMLTTLAADTIPFRWEFTRQRAFEEIKGIVAKGAIVTVFLPLK